MKKQVLLTAAGVIVVGSGIGQTGALPFQAPDAAETMAFETAIAAGSQKALQEFLVHYPQSTFLGSAFGDIVQKITPRNAERVERRAKIWHAQYGAGAGNRDTRARPQRPVGRLASQTAERSIQQVEKASRVFASDLSRCDARLPVQIVNKCVGDALSFYATSLASPKIELPPAAKPIPRVVIRAAKKVRAAPTAAAAREAVQEAVVEVRKQIQLAQVATDSADAEVGTRAGEIVAASLESAAAKLRQVEL